MNIDGFMILMVEGFIAFLIFGGLCALVENVVDKRDKKQ